MNLKRTKNTRRLRSERGLTLVELLIVIAVMSFVVAIAAMSIGGILDRGSEVVAQRNAQQLATVGSVATAAGSTAVTGAPDLATAVDRILAGVDAPLVEGDYQVGGMSDEAKREAMAYLRFESGRLRYTSEAASAD